MEVMRVSPIITAAGGALVGVALPWEFGGPPVNPQSMLRSAEFKGLMESIQSRSASSILGTVESAPMETLTKEAKSSKSSLDVVISSISSLVRLTGELEVTSLFCEAAELPAELLELVVDTTLLPLEGFCKLIDRVVVELIEPFELGELRFKSVIDLLLLLEDRTGSIVKLEPMETVVRAVLG